MILVKKSNVEIFNPQVLQPLISEGKIIPSIFKITENVEKGQVPGVLTFHAETENKLLGMGWGFF